MGRAREIEPHAGFALNRTVIGLGGAAVLIAVFSAGILAAWRVAYFKGAPVGAAAGRLGSLAPALRLAGFPPAAVAGVRMALQRGPRTSPIPIRATLAAAILAVAVAGTAVTFAASLQHLLRTPRLYGQNWDFESGPPPASSPTFFRSLRADPAIAGLAIGAGAFNPPVQINGREVGVRAMDTIIGSVIPTVLAGRAPRTDGEVLLGTKTLHALHVQLGNSVTIRDGRHAASLRVVGRGVLPAGKAIKLGEGAALTFKALKRIQPQAQPDLSEVRLAPGADRDAELSKLTRLFDGSTAVRPQTVTDFGGVGGMPFIVAGLFAAVAAAILAHTLIISIRRRSRDLAILKTLGFTRAQVVATVAWQATTVAAIGAVVGLPLGLGLGRFGYNLFAEDLGVVPEVVVPVGLALLLIPAAVLTANVVAALPGWAAAQTRPAFVLRAE